MTICRFCRAFPLAALWCVSLSCGPRPAHTGSRPSEVGEAIAADAADTAAAPSRRAAPSLVGTWELVTPHQAPGTRISLALDSVVGEQVHGRVRHFIAGDMGLDPDFFRPFVGRLDGVRLHLPIDAADGSPGLLFDGVVHDDTLVLETYGIGPDTLSGDALGRLFVRRRGVREP